MFPHVALVGATGAVGSLMRRMLEERNFPYERISFLASARSAGQKLTFKGQEYTVELLRPEAFDDIDLCLASTPDEVAREFIPMAVERGAVVVDESGAWRMDPRVPLVVPEVNPDAVDQHEGIIASPNCSTTQMVVAMKPLHDAARIQRVVVSTYQATSGAGVAGQRDLQHSCEAFLQGKPYQYEAFQHPIAFNLIPQIGSPKYAGYTSEEMKMVYETHKIFNDDSIRICPTCVRVPVSNCHSETILVETERKLTVEQARDLFRQANGITLVDDLESGLYPMPIHCDGHDDVFVGRLREDLSSHHGLSFWCVSDNLRKGAATNAVQIAELLVTRGVRARVGPAIDMRSLHMTVSYDGTHYGGWQLQPNRVTVQEMLERAITRVTGESQRVIASGRTDAGVHALGQSVSWSTHSELSTDVLRRALNANLPFDIRVLNVQEAPLGFHAIRHAIAKRYRYQIQDGGVCDVFSRHYCWYVSDRLDVSAMQQAAAPLVGRHDFTSFQGAGSVRATTVRTIYDFEVQRVENDGAPRVVIELEADGFLYNMVRILVGSLVEIGHTRQPISWLREVLEQRDRRRAGATAPPHGLFLMQVKSRFP